MTGSAEAQVTSGGIVKRILVAYIIGKNTAIQAVFCSVVLARFLYASPTWWVFATVQDRQKIYGFLRRSTHTVFRSPDLLNVDDLCPQADQNVQ